MKRQALLQKRAAARWRRRGRVLWNRYQGRDSAHGVTYAGKRWADAWACFARNGRWGRCVDCPPGAYEFPGGPEFCCNTDRYDHHITTPPPARCV